MIKLLLIPVLALTQAFLACSQGVFMLCVRQDGQERVWFILTGSCR